MTINELGDELLAFLVQPNLTGDTVIALTVERRRRDDAISEDPRLVKPAENLANFAAENQAVLVSVKSFLPQRPGLENLLRQNYRMLRAGLLLFCRDTPFAAESCAGMK